MPDAIWSLVIVAFALWGFPWLYPKVMFFLRKHEDVEGLHLPFTDTWFTAVGGTVWTNHHLGAPAQQFGYDFVMTDEQEKSYSGEGKENEAYYCFGEPILAPHEGTVLVAVDGIPDNVPGELNPQMVYGNTVMIQHPDGYVSVLAHLKEGSVSVQRGDNITVGQHVGECGNSGNSTEAHLHFHVQNQPGFEMGVGLRPHFVNIEVDGVGYDSHVLKQGQRVTADGYLTDYHSDSLGEVPTPS